MYYLAISFSVIFYVISDILFAKQARSNSTFLINFFRSFVLVCLNIPLVIFGDFDKLSLNIFILSFIFGISGIIYFLSNVYSYKFLPAGVATFIISLESLIVVILGYLFFEEKLSYLGYFGAFLLFLAGIGISLYKSDFGHLDKRWFLGIMIAFLGMFGGAFWGFGFAYISRQTDIFIGSFLSQASIFVIFLFYFFFNFIKNKKIVEKIDKQYIYISVIYGLANLLYFYSTTIGKISISILFLSLCPILVAIVANFIFKEKLSLIQWFFIVIGFIGIILINF